MNNPKVSIIIPVYNTGDYLYKCIYSVINQSLKEIEIIIINDCSTDNTKEICELLEKKDKRIKLINNKTNLGVSICRNKGITVARGKYIGFVDSDDSIHVNMLEKMYRVCEDSGCEISICDVFIHYPNKIIEDKIGGLSQAGIIYKEELKPEYLIQLAGATWRCLYNKDLLVNNEIVFPSNLRLSEDRVFNILAIGRSKKIYYEKSFLYHQTVRNDSATRKYYNNMLEMFRNYYNQVIVSLEKGGFDPSYREEYSKQFFNGIINCLDNEVHSANEKKLHKKLENIRYIIYDPIVNQIIKEIKNRSIYKYLIKHKQLYTIFIFTLIKKYSKEIIKCVR